MEPHALLLNGQVPFYNFTHYDTEDLVRVLEAPYHLWSSAKDAHIWRPKMSDLHISYSHRRAGSRFFTAKARVFNGVRIAQPQHLHSSHIEALVAPRELPTEVVELMLRFANRYLAPHPMYYSTGEVPEINYHVDASTIKVRIHDKINATKPKGYMSPYYVGRMVRSKVSGTLSRTRRSMTSTYNGKLWFGSACKFLRARGIETKEEEEFTRRFELIELQSRELHRDVRTFLKEVNK